MFKENILRCFNKAWQEKAFVFGPVDERMERVPVLITRSILNFDSIVGNKYRLYKEILSMFYTGGLFYTYGSHSSHPDSAVLVFLLPYVAHYHGTLLFSDLYRHNCWKYQLIKTIILFASRMRGLTFNLIFPQWIFSNSSFLNIYSIPASDIIIRMLKIVIENQINNGIIPSSSLLSLFLSHLQNRIDVLDAKCYITHSIPMPRKMFRHFFIIGFIRRLEHKYYLQMRSQLIKRNLNFHKI